MSRSACDTVREFYDLFAAGRIEETVARLADDFVLTNPLPEPIPFGGRFEGTAGFLRYLEQISAALDMEEFVVETIVGDVDHAAVIGRERSRVKSTDRRYAMEWVHVLEVSDGRIRSLHEYNDTAAMRDAFEGSAVARKRNAETGS